MSRGLTGEPLYFVCPDKGALKSSEMGATSDAYIKCGLETRHSVLKLFMGHKKEHWGRQRASVMRGNGPFFVFVQLFRRASNPINGIQWHLSSWLVHCAGNTSAPQRATVMPFPGPVGHSQSFYSNTQAGKLGSKTVPGMLRREPCGVAAGSMRTKTAVDSGCIQIGRDVPLMIMMYPPVSLRRNLSQRGS
jgi:hypothetical protein